MNNFSKHTAIALFSVVLGLTSCTKSDDDSKIDSPQMKTADASLTIKTDDSRATGKNVDRGDLHAWIKDINVKVTSLEFSYIKEFPFTLVTAGRDTQFDLPGLAIGSNRFEISTTTSTEGNFHTEWSNTPLPNLMEVFKERNPYAIYSATFNSNIAAGNNIIPATMLRTQHGRHIAVFKIGEALGNLGVWAVITPIVNGVTKPEMGINVHVNGACYWSNEDAIAGRTIQYDIRLFKADGSPVLNDGVTPVGFKSVVVTLQASTSVNKIYTITDDAITEQSANQTFTAEEWKNNNETSNINVGS